MLYLFDKNENLIKIIPREQIETAISTEKLNNIMTIDVDLASVEYSDISNAEYIGHFDYKNKEKFLMYRITNNILQNSSSIKGIHILFDELKANGYIRDKRPNNLSASDALGTILAGTRWEVGKVFTENKGTTNWYDKSRLDALSDFLSIWNVEIDYRIVFDGQRITGRYVDLYDEIGEDTGRRLVYGSNAIDIKAEEIKSNIYTALIGRGKGEEIKDGETGEATGGYGRRINFKDVEWSKAKGDPVDKPLGQEYVELKEATALYGYSDGSPRIRITEYGDCDNKEELLKLTYAELVDAARPKVELTTEVNRIGTTNLGDSVNIIRKDIGLYYTARVFQIERNLLDDSLTKISLGDYIPTSAEKKNKDYKDRLDKINDALNDFMDKSHQTDEDFLKLLQEGLEQSYYNDDGYNYELKVDNEWNLPAGYYSFDKPINQNPSKVIYMGAGKIAIANSKKADGSWRWTTFGTGDGFVADTIVAGVLKGGKVKWNLETGEFIIGNNAEDFKLKFDGESLIFGSQSLGKDNMTQELKEELKGEQGPPGEPGEPGTDATLPQWWHDWNQSTTTINGDYILTPRMYVGSSNRGVFFGNNVVQSGGRYLSGLVGYWSPDVTFHLDTDGRLTLGNKPGRQFIVDGSGNVTCPKIKSSEIEAGAITTDMLYPGANNRIVLERGKTAGDVNSMSIDVNNEGIRLKKDQYTYILVFDGGFRYYYNGDAVFNLNTTYEELQITDLSLIPKNTPGNALTCGKSSSNRYFDSFYARKYYGRSLNIGEFSLPNKLQEEKKDISYDFFKNFSTNSKEIYLSKIESEDRMMLSETANQFSDAYQIADDNPEIVFQDTNFITETQSLALEKIINKLDLLEKENKSLKEEIEKLKGDGSTNAL